MGGEVLSHCDIFLLYRPFQARSRGCVQTKTFRKDSEASSRAERWRGYVILFSNEPSCCYVATSERRRIRLKADFHYFALRGASIRRSQRSNSEAAFFRGTLPRRYSIRRSQRCNTSSLTSNKFVSSAYCPFYLFLRSRGEYIRLVWNRMYKNRHYLTIIQKNQPFVLW